MQLRRQGLTLIEVLIILVMTGILLTIVISKLRYRKLKETTGALQTEVRNAKVGESKYFAIHNMYGSVPQLDSAKLYRPIPGDSVVIGLTTDGYSVTASRASSTVVCKLSVTGGEAGAASATASCD